MTATNDAAPTTFVPQPDSADIGVYGLGVMGANLAGTSPATGTRWPCSTGPRCVPSVS